MMHQLLQETGKAIVREESPNRPGKRSRLWCHDESFKVLKERKGTDKVKGLVLDMKMLEKEEFCDLKTDAFCNMDNLMILHLNYVQLSGSYEKFPKKLRWLRMHGFRLNSIPSDIPMENLVVLEMPYSKIESFGTWCTRCNSQPPEGRQKQCSKDRRILGSLKILDLSFCEQLHKLCGFYELNKLERLIVRNCKRLTEICESLDECVELVYIDLSYCGNLERVPTAKRKLEKDFTLLLDGCNTRGCISRELFYFANSFGSSIVRLSLKNNNLSNESFPTDFSGLPRLKHLFLDKNPIIFMPPCLKNVPLEELSMIGCKMLRFIEHPPCTLKQLNISMLYLLLDDTTLFEGISFNPDMSPLSIDIVPGPLFRPWSFGIDGMVKIQPLEGVEERVLSALGWTNLLDFINNRDVTTYYLGRRRKHQIQMYYEFGIFSTVYVGLVMPDWITSIKETPISFTIPLSPNKKWLRGLNFCYMQRNPFPFYALLPVIEISNKTKNRTWTYKHCIDVKIKVGEAEWLTYLSHWMFGVDEMEAGDNIVITLDRHVSMEDDDYTDEHDDGWQYKYVDFTRKVEVGVGFVYGDEHGRMEDEEEEDALEYYKSWNHIIGGDLSPFQLETGEYFLYQHPFTQAWRDNLLIGGMYASRYKEETVPFRAFSKKKSPKTPPNGATQQAFSKRKSPKTPSNGAKRLWLSD